MINSLDIQNSVVKLWDSEVLDEIFKIYWTESQKSSFIVLNDTEAAPSQPFPYCVVEFGSNNTIGRSSGSCGQLNQRDYREMPVTFNVHAKHTGSVSAKTIAGELAEKVMRVFGGHPEFKPKPLVLTHGGVLLCQFQTDYSAKTGDQEWQWILNYSIMSDVPSQ